jgi:hypothetical protein
MQDMKTYLALILGVVLSSPAAMAEDTNFLSHPELLKPDARFGDALAYMVEDLTDRAKSYDRVMVDEPVIFIAPDSPYGGFKASDMASLSDMLRQSFAKGLSSEPTTFGTYSIVDQAGTGTLYLRLALKNVYIRKNKRGLLTYTPVGAVAKGVKDAASEAMDKSTLVEMTAEVEVLDSVTNEVLFAGVMDRGHRADKKAKVEEEVANWEATGAIAEVMGRRMACRLDNARRPEGERRDCVAEIPLPQ